MVLQDHQLVHVQEDLDLQEVLDRVAHQDLLVEDLEAAVHVVADAEEVN